MRAFRLAAQVDECGAQTVLRMGPPTARGQVAALPQRDEAASGVALVGLDDDRAGRAVEFRSIPEGVEDQQVVEIEFAALRGLFVEEADEVGLVRVGRDRRVESLSTV